MPDLGWYVVVLLVAAGATAALTVPARRISVRTGYVALPNERTMHKQPIPYGGGPAMFLGLLVAVLAAAAVPALRQVLAASILYFMGVTMTQFKVPLAGFIVLTPGVIPLITALWVIALANAINLIDRLDGLAAGIVAIGARA